MCASFCNSCIRILRKRTAIQACSVISFRLHHGISRWPIVPCISQVMCLKSVSSLRDSLEFHTTNAKAVTVTTENATKSGAVDADVEEPVIAGPSEQLMQSLTESDQHKMKVLWLELDVFRQHGHPVPYQLSDQQWKEAAEMTTRSQRLKFYKFLAIRNSRRQRAKDKKAEKQRMFDSQRPAVSIRDMDLSADIHPQYGLNRNTIFLRLRETTISFVHNHWQCQGIMFGQKLIVDLGFDEHMVKRECSNCAEQIRDMYAFNKMNRQPFHLYLCNANPKDHTLQYLEQFIPNLYSSNCLMTITDKSYVDLLPKENLVYLTPHCKQELLDYDHDATYIIGGIVDKTTPHPVTLAKAKKEGIRMARLPLDHYLDWGTGGNKSLTLDQMMKILLDIKNTGSWIRALENVPKRKLKKDEAYKSPRTQFFPRHRRSLFED